MLIEAGRRKDLLSREELDLKIGTLYLNNTLLVHRLMDEKVPVGRLIESNVKEDVSSIRFPRILS